MIEIDMPATVAAAFAIFVFFIAGLASIIMQEPAIVIIEIVAAIQFFWVSGEIE